MERLTNFALYNKVVNIASFLTILFTLCSCGEDRTKEYMELTGDTHWIYNTMDTWYLWREEMPAMKDYKDYFSEPESFFKKLLSKDDKYSYLEMKDNGTSPSTRSINLGATYGFDFALYVDPVSQASSSPKRAARVLYVLPNSPASEAGINRGDWIVGIGEEQLTTKNYMSLINGPATSLTTSPIEYLYDEETGEVESIQWGTNDTVHISAARWVEDNPYYVDTIYHINERRIAYLMYNRFSTGPNDTGDETEYLNQMRQIFNQLKSENPTDFVLDLRYNPGGYLTCAQLLASLLTPEIGFGKIFCTLRFNDKKMDQNQSYLLEKSLAGAANINLDRLYIITSASTASASESIINGLRPIMGDNNVILVGAQTEGKNVASLSFDSKYNFTLHPIVANIYNGDGFGDYSEGFVPTYEIDELNYINPFMPLGDTREIMLSTTLDIILGNEPSSASTRGIQRSNVPLNPLFISCPLHGQKGFILH